MNDMNQSGIALLAGIAIVMIIATIVGFVLFLLFLKQIVLAGLGLVVVLFAFFLLFKTKKQFLSVIILGIGALLVLSSVLPILPFSLFNQEGIVDMDWPYCSPINDEVKFEVVNPIVSPTQPFEIRLGLKYASYPGGQMPSSGGEARFFVGGEELSSYTRAMQAYDGGNYGYTGLPPTQITWEDFGGRKGKQIIRIEVEDHGGSCFKAFDVEVWIDDSTCILQEGEMVVAESFGAGNTVTVQSLRFPVKAFCSQLPILVTQQGQVVEQKIEEYSIMEASYVTVPVGQTWTFFYIANVSPDMTIICGIDPETGLPSYYNPDTVTCDITPGFVYQCAGIMDPDEGLCIVQPEYKYVCEKEGSFLDISINQCIYIIPEDQTEIICPEDTQLVIDDQEIKKCIYEPSLVPICLKGNYDPETDTCKYLPDAETIIGFPFITIVAISLLLLILSVVIYFKVLKK
jgi:hypothetical protein